MPSKHPNCFNSSAPDVPILALIFNSSIDMNFPSFLASTIPCAATVPKPGMLFRGGLNLSSYIVNFVASDLYKSTGKNSNPLSYISNTISKSSYMSSSAFVASFF